MANRLKMAVVNAIITLHQRGWTNRRIARELHDGIGQSLAISKLSLDKVRDSGSSAALGEAVKEVSKGIEQIISKVSSLSFDLSSPIPYDLGLESAVADLLD